MSGSFHAHFDILPVSQQRLWPKLRPTQSLGLALYGETAAALRIGHRVSVDFDFFTDLTLNRETLFDTFPFLKRALVLQERPNTLSVIVPDEQGDTGVNVSFFGGITFGRVGRPDITADGVMQIASFADLMATKLKVVLQRIEKNYFDIAAMLRAGVQLELGLAAARELYGLAFQPSECLKALVYFEGGDPNRLPEDIRHDLLTAVQNVQELPHVEVASRKLIQNSLAS